MENQNQIPAQSAPLEEKSYFDGGFWGLVGYSILVALVTFLTLGIAFPWMCCVFQKWKARHTVVCGKRMFFDGKGHQLIGRFLLWSLLTLITFGIYSFWMTIAIRKWITKHTHFQGEKDNNSYFDGGIWGFIGTKIVCGLLVWATLGIGTAWSRKIMIDWETKHTVIDSRRLVFTGTGGNLFGKYILWGFLSMITLGIFGLWIPIKQLKWQYKYTIDNEHTTEELIRRSEYRSLVQTQAANHHTQRVQDEMELVKSGVTDSTDQDTLYAIAQKGNKAAQFAYVTRYAEGKYGEEPFGNFLKSSAEQGYAPAMSLYGLSGLAGEESQKLISLAAQNGQIDSAFQVMRTTAQKGLGIQNDTAALPILEEAVHWHDVLTAGGQNMNEEDQKSNEGCSMAVRRIKAKAITKKGGVGKVIGIIALVLVSIAVFALVFSTIFAYFRQVTPALGGTSNSGMMEGLFGSGGNAGMMEGFVGDSDDLAMLEESIGSDGSFGMAEEVIGSSDNFGMAEESVGAANILGILGWLFEGGYISSDSVMEEDIHSATMVPSDLIEEIYQEESTGLPEGVVLSDLTYDDFMSRLRDNLEGDPNYYVISYVDECDRGDHYAMTCNHWYWGSYFDLYVKEYDGYVTSVELDGPRVYETIDETINGQEFQFLLKRLYEVLGLGPNGEEGGVFIAIEPGTNGVQPFTGWEYQHNHTEDNLNTIIVATE